MLTPQRVDTNSLYLTAELNKLGVEVVTKCVIGDDRERLADAGAPRHGRSADRDSLRRARPHRRRSDARSRGPGARPQADLRPRDRRLRWSSASPQPSRKMAEVNKRQAFVIEGADVLPNDRGTAPGQWIEESGACVMLLPGPPHELKAMFERQCLPRLARMVPKQAIRTLFLRVAGMARVRSRSAHRAGLQEVREPGDHHSGRPTATSRSTCARAARPRPRPSALLAEVGGPIELLLGDRIYSRNGDPLEVVVGDLLRKHHATLSVAESVHRRHAGRAHHLRARQLGLFRGRLHHLHATR